MALSKRLVQRAHQQYLAEPLTAEIAGACQTAEESGWDYRISWQAPGDGIGEFDQIDAELRERVVSRDRRRLDDGHIHDRDVLLHILGCLAVEIIVESRHAAGESSPIVPALVHRLDGDGLALV